MSNFPEGLSLNEFKVFLLENTKFKYIFKENSGWKHFFELGEYGLIRTYYTSTGKLGGWERILADPFEILSVCSKNNRITYTIQLYYFHSEVEVIEIQSFKEFKEAVDNRCMIMIRKYLRKAFKCIFHI